MKLWVVTHGSYDDERPVGVYSTEAAADRAASLNCPPKAGDIEYGNWSYAYACQKSRVLEFELDELPEPAYTQGGTAIRWTAERLAELDRLRDLRRING